MPYKTIEIGSAQAVTQQPRKIDHFYKGFSSIDDSRVNTNLYDFDLIQQDIINTFRTKKGERVMNPEFGSIIWDLIMEPLTESTREALRDDIKTICTFDPRVTPTRMDLTEYPEGYVLEVTLQINGTDQSSNMRLVFDRQIGLSVQ